jgi:uncharacterized protein (UPF0332 family)
MGAISRFYYAAFYAASALLATRQLDSSKHSGVISLFQTNFVKTGLFNKEKAKALPRSFEKRQKTDYGDFAVVAPAEARNIREEVLAFIDECSRLIDSLTQEQANNKGQSGA